jgi:Alpha-glucuronidase
MKPATRARSQILIFFAACCVSHFACAQFYFENNDGYRLWQKYDTIEDKVTRQQMREKLTTLNISGNSATTKIIREELKYALTGLLGHPPRFSQKLEDQQLIIGTPETLPKKVYSQLNPLEKLGEEGYRIRSLTVQGKNLTVIIGNSDTAILYGTYHLLRLIQTHTNISALNITEIPKIDIRVLNHWDNLDRHVERGYAGESIWDWHKLPDYKYQRYYDYARANASIGINGTVLNNVNANPDILRPEYLQKVAALAEVFRPYGIKVYLSINFSSPHIIGGLKTSDPLNLEVAQWWKAKADEIYQLIPDFGGFLVKANSEGQPGPGDFGRTHAEGANMLADVLKPHGGIVMWRAFVYANEKNEERSKQAYSEFKPLDGQFRKNVLVQSKNGPIDFQPREPISPLFGATPQTPIMMEFQITLEYLGLSTHLVYLGPLYEEVLNTDTGAKGKGSTVGKIIDGSLFNNTISGMAGVANIGSDRNWTGHIMLQSNWYVFGRLAWNHEQTAKDIANDWIRMTLTNDHETVNTISNMMMASRETTVNYMTPLGLHHIMGTGHHYGPGPWVNNLGRDDWNPVYYHRANSQGIGFNRSATGENAIEQYHPELRQLYAKPETTPDEFLLWFHHLPWDYKMKSGKNLWDELTHRYYQGAENVKQMHKEWLKLESKIDPHPFNQVKMALEIQEQEAIWWRNACVLYFQQFSRLPIPNGLEKPQGTLAEYKAAQFPYAPGQGG